MYTHRNIRTYLSHTIQIEIKVEKWRRSNSSLPDSLLTHISRGEFLEVMPSKGCGWGREQLRCWLHKSPMWEPFLIQNYCIDVLAKSSALFQPAWWLIFNLTEVKKKKWDRKWEPWGWQAASKYTASHLPAIPSAVHHGNKSLSSFAEQTDLLNQRVYSVERKIGAGGEVTDFPRQLGQPPQFTFLNLASWFHFL